MTDILGLQDFCGVRTRNVVYHHHGHTHQKKPDTPDTHDTPDTPETQDTPDSLDTPHTPDMLDTP